MTKVFIPNEIATKEIFRVIQEVAAAGYDKNQAFIGANFNEFVAPLKKGDVAVVYSLTLFHSVSEILSVVEQLASKGVEFRSICEPWLQDSQIAAKELLAKLFLLGEQLHQPVPRPTSPKISRKLPRKNPAVLQIASRVALATELVKKKQLSVVEACRTAGCSVSAYYTHRKVEGNPTDGTALKK